MASSPHPFIASVCLGVALLIGAAATLFACAGYVVATMRNGHHQIVARNMLDGSHLLRRRENDRPPTLLDGRAWNIVVAQGDPELVMPHDADGNTESGADFEPFQRWAIVYPPPGMALAAPWLTGLTMLPLAIALGGFGRAGHRLPFVMATTACVVMMAAAFCTWRFARDANDTTTADSRAALLLDWQIVRPEAWNAMVDAGEANQPPLPLGPEARPRRIAIVRSELTTSCIGWATFAPITLGLQLTAAALASAAIVLIARSRTTVPPTA